MSLIKQVKKDIYSHGGRSVSGAIKVYLFNPSFRLLLNFRIGKFLSTHQLKLFRTLSAYYRYAMICRRCCDISYKAEIGNNVKFPHPVGIVIGEGAVIGDNVRIWQNVTLGSHGKTGVNVAYPTVMQGSKIFAGAVIIGKVTIGNNSIVGANSFVNKDVPNYSIATGVPITVRAK